MAKHKKKSLAKHLRKKRNKEAKQMGVGLAKGFSEGVTKKGVAEQNGEKEQETL